MQHSFTIPERALSGFQALSNLGVAKLEKFAAALKRQEATLDIDRMAEGLSKQIEFDDAETLADTISLVLIPLSRLREKFRLGAETFLSLVRQQLEVDAPAEWVKKWIGKWDKVASTVGAMLDPTGKFALLGKAYELLRDRPALPTNLKIRTDLRPVFDDDADQVRAMLLTSTLVVDYQEGRARHLHLTLGLEELRRLKQQIERAEKKAQTLQALMSDSETLILVLGE